MKKKTVNLYLGLLFIMVVISYIFIDKTIYLAPNLNVSISLIPYAFSFLLIALIHNRYSLKEARLSIYYTYLLLFLFYIIIILLNTIDSIIATKLISDSLKEVFTPNYYNIKSLVLFYPNYSLITFGLIYFISHYIFIIIYEVITDSSNRLIGFILALLIGFILDQLLFVPINSISGLVDGSITYKLLIEKMTASFIFLILSSLVLLIIYSITNKKKK